MLSHTPLRWAQQPSCHESWHESCQNRTNAFKVYLIGFLGSEALNNEIGILNIRYIVQKLGSFNATLWNYCIAHLRRWNHSAHLTDVNK